MTYPSRVCAVSLTIRDLLTQPPIYPRDVLTTEARMPTNSEAIGVISFLKSVPIPSYAWSRNTTRTRNTWDWVRVWKIVLFSTTPRFCDIKV